MFANPIIIMVSATVQYAVECANLSNVI